jgi:hypothetical protein
MHLYITLQQDIGLKSFIVTRFSTFSTKAILVALTHLRKVENSKKYFITKNPPTLFEKQ